MAKKVIKIPARVNKFTATPIGTTKKRRVAAYARVSTDHEEQLNSYEAQVDYYTNYIKNREDWEFVSVYADEGITGTSIKKRAGFSKMVDDALAGHIDLIVTKSVSRFARNTVDSLTTIRKLKESGVEVYFEEQNIYTFDSSGELLITIMSSLAQEEARSISENTTWGQRKRFADGKVMVPFGRFLGYERGENGELVVNEEQAEVVRRIYGLFLQGRSPYSIAKQLTAEGVPTPGGKTNWCSATVRSILTNEKYKGDALLQKVFTTDFLTKKKKVNEGEVPQYYIEGNHEAIIAPDVFDSVQLLMEKRVKNDGRPSCVSCFSSKIKCGHCGAWYGSKVWHSNSKYRRIIWRCNRKYENEERCDTPHLYEDDIKKMFVRALNNFCSEKEAILADFESIKATAFQTDELEKKRDELQNELTVLMEMMERCINENARVALDQNEYEARYKALEEKAEAAKAQLDTVSDDIVLRQAQREMMKNFIDELRKLPETCEQFDEDTWYALVDYVTVYSAEDIRFTFNNGAEIRI